MIAIGLAAGCLGSLVGTLLMVIHEVYLSPNVLPKSDLSTTAMVAPAVAMISLFGTLPGSALVGVPTLYAIRYRIASRPLLWLLPVIGLAILLAFVVLRLGFGEFRADSRDVEIVVCYPTGCAIGFVALLGVWGKMTR